MQQARGGRNHWAEAVADFASEDDRFKLRSP
jgi:hypothetical protein